MRQAHVKRQFDAAIHNVELALRDLSDRLEAMSGTATPRSRIRRAGRTLKKKAGSFADHVPLERASAIAVDTGRTVREHPVKTVLTAAIAGYCIWSLIQYSTSRTAAGGRARTREARTDVSSGRHTPQDEGKHGGERPDEPEGFARH